MISRPRFGFAFLASLLLGACGLPGGEPSPPTARVTAGAAAAPGPGAAASPASPVIGLPEDASPAKTGGGDAPSAEEAVGGNTPSVQKAGAGEAAPRLAMRPMNKLAPPDPGRLIGMGRDQVAGLLGPPSFRRRDDPALVWQYRSAACILDVFLYRKGAAYSVAHFEVRGVSVVEVDQNACFLGLLRDRAKSG